MYLAILDSGYTEKINNYHSHNENNNRNHFYFESIYSTAFM